MVMPFVPNVINYPPRSEEPGVDARLMRAAFLKATVAHEAARVGDKEGGKPCA